MKIYLTKEQCTVSIPQLYENISYIINGESKPMYDCTKICVTEKIYEAVKEYYESLGHSLPEINMAWLFGGPKASIEEDSYAVEVEDNWCDGESD